MIKPDYALMFKAIDTGCFVDDIAGNKQTCANLLAVTKTSFGFHYRQQILDTFGSNWDWAHQFDMVREKVKEEFIELCLAEMDK